MSVHDIAVPRKMNALMRDRRGYPVPYTVLRDSDGVPHFAVNDSERVLRCIREKRCAICGTRLDREMWLVGGPLSAFLTAGRYRDPALHYECARYALQVCPYLASRKYSGRIDTAGIDFDKVPPAMLFADSTMLPEHPEVFVAICTSGIRDETPGGSFVTVVPNRPYIRVEFWQDGYLLHFADGAAIAQRALDAFQRTQRAPSQSLSISQA